MSQVSLLFVNVVYNGVDTMSKRAQHEGTIYKKTVVKNGQQYTYWSAQVTIGYDKGDGHRIRRTFYGSTQAEVRQKMQAASTALDSRDYFEPSSMALSAWIDTWLADYCGEIKYLTKRHYFAQCNAHIKPALGAIKLGELATPHIQRFINGLAKTGKTRSIKDKKTGIVETTHSPLSPKSIRNIYGILSKCLNTAVEIGYIRTNPAKYAKLPRASRKEVQPLTNEQIGLFLSALESEPYANLFKLLLFTGLREAEAIGLTWDCVDMERGILTINKQLQRRPKPEGRYAFTPLKNDKTRILTIPQFLIDVLTDQKKRQDNDRESAGDAWQESNLVFTTSTGQPIDYRYLYYHYKKIAAEIGAPESRVHDLRHTYAVLSLQNGDDVKTVQENLGHATAAFTLDVYGHATDRMKKESASRMQSFIATVTEKKD